MRYKWLVVLISFVLLGYNGVAFAAGDSVGEMAAGLGGFGGTFQSQLGNLTKGLVSAAKIIVTIMTATAACMIAFGIQDGRKTFWNWILGVGLAVNFGDLILTFWNVQSGGAGTKLPDYNLVLKNGKEPEIDIIAPFMQYYIGVIQSGAAAVVPYAVNLTLILATLEGTFKIAFGLISGDKIKYAVIMTVKVGMFIFLIQNWIGTNSGYQLMPMLGSGFETMGYTAGGAEEMVKSYSAANPDSNIDVQSGSIVTNALNFWNIFWEKVDGKNILTCLVGFICVVAAVVILFLTALEMFMARIEFWTMALITLVLLPFGVIGQLKFLADKAIGAMFNLAIKLFVIAFISTMSVNILTALVNNAKTVSQSADFAGNISYFLQVLLYALILFLLTKKIPALVQGLLSGNPSLGGGDMKQMAMQAAQTAAQVGAAVASGGASAAGGLAKGMGAMKSLSDASKWSGGMGGAMGVAAKGMASKAMSGMQKSMAAAKKNNPFSRGYNAMNDTLLAGLQSGNKPPKLNEGQAAHPASESSSSGSSSRPSTVGSQPMPNKTSAPTGGSQISTGNNTSQLKPNMRKSSDSLQWNGSSSKAAQNTAATTTERFVHNNTSDNDSAPSDDNDYAPPPKEYSAPSDEQYDDYVSPTIKGSENNQPTGEKISSPVNSQNGKNNNNASKQNNDKTNNKPKNNPPPPKDNETSPPKYK